MTAVDRVAKRVTVNLSTRAYNALLAIVTCSGDSKTGAINRALQVYAMVCIAQKSGGGVFIQDDSESQPKAVRFW